MTELRDQLIAIKFKPVDGGYLLRAPYYLGRKAPTYLVNEAQKAALVDVLIPRHQWRRAFAISGAILAATVASVLAIFALSPHQNPTAVDTLAMLALTGLMLLAGFLVLRHWTLRKAKPILDGLPRATVSLTMAEQRKTMMNTLSTKMLIFIAAVNAFNAAMVGANGAFSLSSGKGFGYVMLGAGCVSLGVAVYYGVRLIGRWMDRTAKA